jgi:hypothetical protein
MAAELTQVEASALDDCEQRIAAGMRTFVEVGSALLRIRDERLYRTTYGTFEDYCEQRWSISRPRAYELISAVGVVSAIADTGQSPPENEAQARELARVPEADRADVWRETVERTNGTRRTRRAGTRPLLTPQALAAARAAGRAIAAQTTDATWLAVARICSGTTGRHPVA